MTSLLLIGCFILAVLAIAGVVIFLLIGRQGQGVSDARQGWIEGTSYRDDD